MTYTYYAALLTTGEVLTELPLTGFSGERTLGLGGQMSANLVLQGLDQDRRRELLAATAEGKCTVVADRDGVVMGEWIIWRSNPDALTDAPIPIVGQEVMSYLTMRPMPAVNWGQLDQVAIAVLMARSGFWVNLDPTAPGSVAVDCPSPTYSGVLRDRVYTEAEAPISQRLDELSQVIDGFDYWIESRWDWSQGFRAVKRTFTTAYPSAGSYTSLVFDQAPPTWKDGRVTQHSGGSITAMQTSWDATRLGTDAVAVCSGKGDGRVLGHASDDTLIDNGWPALTQMHSWTTVSVQATADAHASALLSVSQTAEVPPTVTVLADGDPALGDYQLGDRVRLHVGETTNLPDGYDETVRILGWTIAPPDSGVETVDLTVTSILPDVENENT